MTSIYNKENSELPFSSSETKKQTSYPRWYSPETGICHSTFPSVHLPTHPFLDVVSLIFSHQHNGFSALIDSSSGFSISYSQLFPLVKTLASALHRFGISQGDVVLLLLPNSVYFPVLFLAVLYLGAVVSTINPLSTVSEIKKQVAECKVRLVFTVHDNIEKLKSLGLSVIAVPENVGTGCEDVAFSDFYKLISGNDELVKKPVIRQDDTAAILYSSGTTGPSKGVVLTHKNFIAAVELFVRFEASQYDGFTWKNVYLAALPMFHIYGISLFVLGLLSLGSSIVVMRKFDVNEMVRVIDEYEVTHFPAVPPIMMALVKVAKTRSGKSFKSLKQVSCGAAPLSGKIIEDFVQFLHHVDLIQGYGMTESTAVGTRGFNTGKFRKYASVGLLAPNMQAKVVNWRNGSSLPPGLSGELLLRGPGIMKEYMNNMDATRSTIDNDGWLHTGDIVYFDQNGYLYVIDRVKEIIKYKGFQIAPADLEAVLIGHPEILDVAVAAAMDEELGEIPVAFVVRRPGSKLTQTAVIKYLAQKVAPYKKVRRVVFVNAIPKSPAGKILRRELRNSLTPASRL